MKKLAYIFIQSNKDVIYAIDLIISKKNLYNYEIVITCNLEVYKYFIKLFGNRYNVYFFKTNKLKSFSNVFLYLKLKKHIYSCVKHKLQKDIYFFSDLFDYVTPYLINNLGNVSNLYHINSLPINTIKKKELTFRENLFIKTSFYLFKLNVQYVLIKNQKVKKFESKLFKTKINHSIKNDLTPYLLNFKFYSKTSVIVLNENFFDKENETKIINKIIRILKDNNFHVYLKMHPNCLIKYDNFKYDTLIQEKLPIEIFSFPKNTVIIGFSSASLSNPTAINYNFVSLIKFLGISNNNNYDFNYIVNLNESVYFPNNFDDFSNYIISID